MSTRDLWIVWGVGLVLEAALIVGAIAFSNWWLLGSGAVAYAVTVVATWKLTR